jgi:hypothetical protein
MNYHADRINIDHGFSVGQKTGLRYFPLGQHFRGTLASRSPCGRREPLPYVQFTPVKAGVMIEQRHCVASMR